jgi:hypothetical protein
MQSSQSSGDQFSRAIRNADPRSRATVNPAVPVTDIQHGHENDPVNELPQKWIDQAASTGLPSDLFPGMPRNADGTQRPA